MCGIAGYWQADSSRSSRGALMSAIDKMRQRGPDDEGTSIQSTAWGEVGLAHTRLAVIDLSPNGRQPMCSNDGRFALVFNGEIYNYREIREDLSSTGSIFRTHTDTEVLLAAWARWGPLALPRLKGMFAFAIVDFERATLTCARDAFGIKPLLLSYQPHAFHFASDVAAVASLRTAGAQLNLQTAYDYLVHGSYDDEERTFVDGISHLLPGTYRVLDMRSGELSAAERWWSPSPVQTSGLSFDQAAGHLRELFLDNVRLHLRSDVPLGAALSGGIDSAAIVCAIRHVDPSARIRTFSFVARDAQVSEEPWIQLVNEYVKAEHHLVVIEPQELARDLDDMIIAQGEPFGSTSIYAQYRVYRLAREQGVTVTLDGQGADELLAGYHGFPAQRAHSLIEQGQWLNAASFLLRWSRWPDRTLPRAAKGLLDEFAGDRIHGTFRRLANPAVAPRWIDGRFLHQRGVRLRHPRLRPERAIAGRRLVAELAHSATRRGLPALLRHGDRNSMRFSVESRVPFLTTDLADFLFSLPEHFLVSNHGETKAVLRAALRGIVPDAVLDRRDKIGFATPEFDWLSVLGAQVREWIGEAQQIEFLRVPQMLEELDHVLAGRARFSWQAWRWINFCRWHTRVFQAMRG